MAADEPRTSRPIDGRSRRCRLHAGPGARRRFQRQSRGGSCWSWRGGHRRTGCQPQGLVGVVLGARVGERVQGACAPDESIMAQPRMDGEFKAIRVAMHAAHVNGDLIAADQEQSGGATLGSRRQAASTPDVRSGWTAEAPTPECPRKSSRPQTICVRLAVKPGFRARPACARASGQVEGHLIVHDEDLHPRER